MNLALRKAVIGDAECIAILGATVWIDTYAAHGIRRDIGRYLRAEFSVDRIAMLISDATSHLVVAERDSHILGYAHTIQGAVCPASAGHRTELVNLYVLEAFTGSGIGTQLLRESESFCGSPKRTAVVLRERGQYSSHSVLQSSRVSRCRRTPL